MRLKVPSIVAGCVLGAAIATHALPAVQGRSAVKPITWADTVPLRARLEARGLTPASFPPYVDGLRQAHARRVREGDLDHLVFYLLQSTSFTSLPSIEPALSAKALVEGLGEQQREKFLRTGEGPASLVSGAVRSRIARLCSSRSAHRRVTRDCSTSAS